MRAETVIAAIAIAIIIVQALRAVL